MQHERFFQRLNKSARPPVAPNQRLQPRSSLRDAPAEPRRWLPLKQRSDGKSASPMNKPSDLEACPILVGVPPEDLRRDCPTARIVAIRHRGTIYRQGDPTRAIYCVLDGQVTI